MMDKIIFSVRFLIRLTIFPSTRSVTLNFDSQSDMTFKLYFEKSK